jgi:hypothetical protein
MTVKSRQISRGGFIYAVLAVFCGAIGGQPAFSATALAPKPNITLELFTSQGCSSCPPADRLLEQLARESGIVALSRPVQYWDQLGWKDTLATAENTERQYRYVRAFGQSGAYTPQLVIDGVADAIGSHESTVRARIAQQAQHKQGVTIVSETRADGSIEVRLTGPAAGAAEIRLLGLRASATVPVERGENARSQLHYINVVLEDIAIAHWTGGNQSFVVAAQDLKRLKGDRRAILVQAAGSGQIFGADFIQANIQ